MTKFISKTALSALCLATTVTTLSATAVAQETTEKAPCVAPTQPIIPDGNVATKDELLSASKAVKELQKELLVYRECLNTKSAAIIGEDEDSTALKQAYIERYNASVDLEEKVAGEFNVSIGAFKSK